MRARPRPPILATLIIATLIITPLILAGSAAVSAAHAASQAELDRLNGFALLLGRALGCDLDTARAQRVIGDWLDATFPPGSPEQERSLQQFAEGLRFHAREQHQGRSPDSCADIAQAFDDLDW